MSCALGTAVQTCALPLSPQCIEIPDYQPTLANTEKILLALTQRVDVIAKSPAMTLTPETMGERVNASVASATGELHNLLNSTRSDMSEAVRDFSGLIGTTSARRSDKRSVGTDGGVRVRTRWWP